MTGLARRHRAQALGISGDLAKRALDVTLAVVLIAALGGLLVVLCGLVRFTSPGPVFFRQERLGLARRPFRMLKLRTMCVDNDDRIHREYVASLLAGDTQRASTGGLFKLQDDPRITQVGAWLRRTSLDELPQLINVLTGDMSLVGPRPVLPWEADMFSEVDRRRFDVKPGMTGLWQVSGRSRLTMRDALALDAEYVRRQSLALDLAILIRTIPAILRGGAA